MKYQKILFLFITSVQGIIEKFVRDIETAAISEKIINKIQKSAIEYKIMKCKKNREPYLEYEDFPSIIFKEMVEDLYHKNKDIYFFHYIMKILISLTLMIVGLYTISYKIDELIETDSINYWIGSIVRIITFPFIASIYLEYIYFPLREVYVIDKEYFDAYFYFKENY